MRKIDKNELTQHLKNLDVYGYTSVPRFMDANTLEKLKDLVSVNHGKVAEQQYEGRPNRDANDKIIYNLQNKDKFFIDIISDDFIKTVLMNKLNDEHYRFLPPDNPNYILGYYNARSSGGALDLHIDSSIPARGDYAWVMQVAFILNDQDENNGCTTVVPGSHQSGNFTDRSLENVKPLISKAGDLVMWDSRLWHGTLANTNGMDRWSLIATFNRWWVKPSMDMTRSLPDEMYSQLSNEQKAVLGFCSIPPSDEFTRVNTKCGYDYLKDSVADYYKD